MGKFVDPKEVAAVSDGGVVTLTISIKGVGPWGVSKLAVKFARGLLGSPFVDSVRINNGPGLGRDGGLG